jgi:hypothetical protein
VIPSKKFIYNSISKRVLFADPPLPEYTRYLRQRLTSDFCVRGHNINKVAQLQSYPVVA